MIIAWKNKVAANIIKHYHKKIPTYNLGDKVLVFLKEKGVAGSHWMAIIVKQVGDMYCVLWLDKGLKGAPQFLLSQRVYTVKELRKYVDQENT